MWGISTQESLEEAREAADGCSKWIFLVCNEATSSASARACGVGVFWGWGGGGLQLERRTER